MPSFSDALDAILIDGNSMLTSVSLGTVTSATAITLQQCDMLASVAFVGTTTVTGNLVVNNNDVLTSVTFPAMGMDGITGTGTVTDNPMLPGSVRTALDNHVAGTFTDTGNCGC